jgi:hypothetical protein
VIPALTLTVDDLPAAGVRLMSPAEPDFDAVARPLIGERVADVALQLKPILTVVSNDSGRTIVSCSVVWMLTHVGARTTRIWGHTSFPKAACGDVLPGRDEGGFPAGTRRAHSPEIVVHRLGAQEPYYDQFLPQFVSRTRGLVADATSLRIELNAVIFDDGTVVGPDTDSMLQNQFESCVVAKKARYRALLDALDEGRSLEDALSHSDRQLFMRDDWDALWSQQALGEAAAWCRHHAGGDLRALIRDLRLEAFIVRRTGA